LPLNDREAKRYGKTAPALFFVKFFPNRCVYSYKHPRIINVSQIIMSKGVCERAENAESLVQTLASDTIISPSNQDQQRKHVHTVKSLIDDYEDRLAQTEMARKEADAHRNAAQEIEGVEEVTEDEISNEFYWIMTTNCRRHGWA
jgi:hypothetical protein